MFGVVNKCPSVGLLSSHSSDMFAILMSRCLLNSVQGSQKKWGKRVAEICRLRVGALVFKCQNPLANMGQSKSNRVQREGSSGGYFAAVLKAPWPINRLFEFPPRRACHVSIREGLFLLPVRLLAAGGSHTSHLAVHLTVTCVIKSANNFLNYLINSLVSKT